MMGSKNTGVTPYPLSGVTSDRPLKQESDSVAAIAPDGGMHLLAMNQLDTVKLRWYTDEVMGYASGNMGA